MFFNMTLIPNKCAKNFCLPILGLGTYQIGTEQQNSNDIDAKSVASLKQAIELGFTHIDTAESYGEGRSEQLVGVAIKDFDRSQLKITTKVRRSHLRYDDLIRAAKGSLKRLGIKTIDLYLIHGPSSEVLINESMKAMDYLLENELIRNIGVSNFNTEQLAAALAATKYSIVNNQIHYNLGARVFEQNGTIAFCQKHNILVTAYRIIGYDQLAPGMSILNRLATKYQRTPIQIAINWLINQPNIVGLVKAVNPDHLRENLGALGWKLEDRDKEYLASQFPTGETMNI